MEKENYAGNWLTQVYFEKWPLKWSVSLQQRTIEVSVVTTRCQASKTMIKQTANKTN